MPPEKPSELVYLFGSFTRGGANSKSDFDILVELDYSKKIGFEYFTMQLELATLLDKSVDLVSEKALSHQVRPFVEKDKYLIYKR